MAGTFDPMPLPGFHGWVGNVIAVIGAAVLIGAFFLARYDRRRRRDQEKGRAAIRTPGR